MIWSVYLYSYEMAPLPYTLMRWSVFLYSYEKIDSPSCTLMTWFLCLYAYEMVHLQLLFWNSPFAYIFLWNGLFIGYTLMRWSLCLYPYEVAHFLICSHASAERCTLLFHSRQEQSAILHTILLPFAVGLKTFSSEGLSTDWSDLEICAINRMIVIVINYMYIADRNS